MPFTDRNGCQWTAVSPGCPDDVADLTTNYYVRQNPYKTDTYGLYSIASVSKKLHVPFTHTKADVDAYLANPQEYLRTANDKARLLLSLPVGTLITVVGKREAMIVKITSDVKAGFCAPIYIVRNPDIYNGVYSEEMKDRYTNSIVQFLVPSSEFQSKINEYFRKGYIFEPFYCLYRDFEFICTIECEDMRMVGGVASSGPRTVHYFHYEYPPCA